MTLTLSQLSLKDQTQSNDGDYYQYHFDSSSVPEKKIVGLLSCQRQPLLRHLNTRLISASPSEIAAPPIQKGKGIKKKSKSSTSASEANGSSDAPASIESAGKEGSKGRLWDVEVLDTVIFPEGGGQPFDTGSMSLPGGVDLTVEGCLRRNLDSIHLVRVPEEHEALLQNTIGKQVDLEVDWERRMDHMSIHTSQHLLSAILDHYAEGLPTLSWSVPAFPSIEPPYVELPRGLTWKEIQEVEDKCNAAIAEARKVWVEVAIQGEENGDGRESRGLPKDYDGGVIRHVIIDGIDRNACCGTQLPNILLIGSMHIIPPSLPSTSTTPSASPTKLFFTAGPRANLYLRNASRQVSLVAQALGTGRASVVEKSTFLEESRKEGNSQATEMKKEISKFVVDQIISSFTESSKSAISIHRTTTATHDFDWLSTTALTAANTISNEGKTVPIIVLSSAPADVKPSMIVVFGTDDKHAKGVFEKLKSGLEEIGDKGRMKGGGARGKYMGKVEGKFGKKEMEVIEKIVAEIDQAST